MLQVKVTFFTITVLGLKGKMLFPLTRLLGNLCQINKNVTGLKDTLEESQLFKKLKLPF